MPEIVRMPVEGGEPILLEVDRRTDRVGRGQDQIDTAGESLQRSLGRVQEIAGHVFDRLSALPRTPDRIRVEFGVKLTADANVILTRTGGEAHFVIEMEWENGQAGGDAGA
ncbi:CU044_2847 family protein [Streptomyces sp. NPDC006540]|uniref:CU044_2847 family protein n=1 Tax=Streptomyces sp. NPDC006540 TaxID=3155353 RepID=UPI0033BBB599